MDNLPDRLLGMLCLVRAEAPIEPSAMTSWRFAAYISDAPVEVVEQSQPHRFAHDYVVVRADRITDYVGGLMKSSPVWGGFVHHSAVSVGSGCVKLIPSITALEGLRIPSSLHENELIAAISAPNHFDRYLKKYHQLELWLDYAFVDRIKRSGEDIRIAVGAMSLYSSGELERLNYIVSTFVIDPSAIEGAINRAASYADIAFEMFETWGKKGNPINDNNREKAWGKIRAGAVTFPDLRGIGGGKGTEEERYRRFILEVASYWIYRARCCVAHRRIGEFIIADEHQEFYIEFAEPLIDALIAQVFTERP